MQTLGGCNCDYRGAEEVGECIRAMASYHELCVMDLQVHLFTENVHHQGEVEQQCCDCSYVI